MTEGRKVLPSLPCHVKEGMDQQLEDQETCTCIKAHTTVPINLRVIPSSLVSDFKTSEVKPCNANCVRAYVLVWNALQCQAKRKKVTPAHVAKDLNKHSCAAP